MKIETILMLISFCIFSSCLKSEYTLELEESSQISFDDCPFYGFWADTLWCADSFSVKKIGWLGENTYSFYANKSITQFGKHNHMYEVFYIVLENFTGVGKYTFPIIPDEPNRNFSFYIRDYDLRRDYHALRDSIAGDYGEIIITQFNEQSGLIKGEARAQLTSLENNQKQKLRGARFKGYLPK